MHKEAILYTGTAGLVTSVKSRDIPYNPETGITGLAKAVNVKVDTGSKISRVKGFSELFSGSYHSGWFDKNFAFCGKGTSLYQFLPDRTLRLVKTGMTGNRIRFTRHGERVYFSDDQNYGYIKNSTAYDWPESNYLGPETKRPYSSAKGPIKHMCVFNGRIYVVYHADPTRIYRSKKGQLGLIFHAQSHWRVEKPVIMLLAQHSGDSGIFMSTTENTYFLDCTLVKPKLNKLRSYPAIEFSESCKRKPCAEVGVDMKGEVVLWNSAKGPCMGLPSGDMINMTEKLVQPSSCSGYGASVIAGPYLIHSTGI